MRKMIKRIAFCFVIAALVWGYSLLRDRKVLNEQLIRLHVVANSDSEADQSIKLQVRDAILESLQGDLQQLQDVEAAKNYIRENLPKLQTVANQVLHQAGFEQHAVVRLCKEAFPTRYYDTFRLPSGVYETLRITIGDGAGHNWWCVTFPGLCVSATTDGFSQAAVEAGFSETLTDTLTTDDPPKLRFFVLDWMGSIKGRLFQES